MEFRVTDEVPERLWTGTTRLLDYKLLADHLVVPRDGLATSPDDVLVAVLVNPELLESSKPLLVMVDARPAKRNVDTRIDQARLVGRFGPVFLTELIGCCGRDNTRSSPGKGYPRWFCSTRHRCSGRGWQGDGQGVLRTSRTGPIVWSVEIDVTISAGESMGTAGEIVVTTSISGVIRGLISPGHDVAAGFKIGDIAPRGMRAACFEISNKARAVGGGVLKVVLTWFDRMSA